MKSRYAINDFLRETYKKDSPIPFIITAQIIVFLVIHFFKLLFDVELISTPVFDWVLKMMSLPSSFEQFIGQPWSIITYPLIYASIFNLLFDCLWLYFIGNMFLNLLNKRQFLTVYIGGAMIGGVLYLIINRFLPLNDSISLYNSAMPIAALLAATATLISKSEVRLFIFGNVKIYILISIYLGIKLIQFAFHDPAIAFSYTLTVLFGFLFMTSLKRGTDWSTHFEKSPKRKLKVVHHSANKFGQQNNNQLLSNQEVIDGILDKISAQGYESLTSQEKETLFKASKED